MCFATVKYFAVWLIRSSRSSATHSIHLKKSTIYELIPANVYHLNKNSKPTTFRSYFYEDMRAFDYDI